jgi:hypothetical protein
VEWSRDEELKRELFYAFLRNRVPPEASDFPSFMGKCFWAWIPLGNKRVRFYHLYSEFLSVSGSNPTLSAIFFNGKKKKGLSAERKFPTKNFYRI